MFVKERLYTPEGGFVTEVEIPEFENKPEVLIWGARVFVYVDSLVDLQAGGSGYLHPLDIIGEDGCYVEAFAYHVPPRAEDMPIRRPETAEGRMMGVTDRREIAPDHYISRLRKPDAYNVAALERMLDKAPPNDGIIEGNLGEPLTDRVYVPPGKERVLCSCVDAPGVGYHWAKCPTAKAALLNGEARSVYARSVSVEIEEPIQSQCATCHQLGHSAYNCPHDNGPDSFGGSDY